ncbi:MAG: phosphoglyceromutase [Acidimicrobiia bacterium]|nr:phosphoglyceromutase [Acidimicrobiia bacterium]
MSTLILLRHGQSVWNESNQFTGWYDVELTEQGRAEAVDAARVLTEAGIEPDIVHTSLQKRAIITADLCLEAMDRLWIPVRRSWRLNERHYGDLTGLDKAATLARHGEEQLNAWRRGYRTPPPDIADDNPYNPNVADAYAGLPAELLPKAECLADVVERLLPYWYDTIVPDLAHGQTVLVAAHGNSLRGLAKHLDDITDDDIPELNIPTGMPIRYELGPDFRPVERRPTLDRALDPTAAAAAAEAVANQAKG